jgi:tRNA threonylcarbamoyladenosine biosynthesis protein TsaB
MSKNFILGIDTCTRWLNLALLDESGGVAGEVHEEVATHTTRLVPALSALLTSGVAERRDLRALGVVVGPGSFTGLRVGLSSTLGLSKALAIPAFGLDSLTALALASGGEGEGVALLDARRSQVYARWFAGSGARAFPLGEPEALSPLRLMSEGRIPAWAAGDGVPLVLDWPSSTVLAPGIPNLALPAARRAWEGLRSGFRPDSLEPLYVRPPDVRAETAKQRNSETGGGA